MLLIHSAPKTTACYSNTLQPSLCRRINHAHNLRLRYKRKRINTLEQHFLYLPVSKFVGGDDTRGRLPSKINRLIDCIRALAEPALVINWPAADIVEGIV